MDLRDKLKQIRYLALDFDGVMTDNTVTIDQHGNESVTCNRSDGLGIRLVKAAGIEVGVFSSSYCDAARYRCKALNVPYHATGLDGKLEALQGVWPNLDEVLFVGNDVNDLECMRAVGLAVCPHDAHHLVCREFSRASQSEFHDAGVVLYRPGGGGFVRNVCDMLIEARRG